MRAAFFNLAARHGVLGLVLVAMERALGRDALSRDPWAQLAPELRRIRKRTAVLQLERDYVLSILATEGITAVVLKGAGLASTVFREPAEREYGDMDLLVTPAQLDSAVAVLGNRGYVNLNAAAIQGYRAHHFHIRIQRPGATIVELHWNLTHKTEPFRLDPAAFRSRSVEVQPARARPSSAPATTLPLRVPSAEDALLHIVVEVLRGSFSRIKWLVDLDRIIATAPSMDWSYVLSAARTGASLLPVSLSLGLCRQMLGTTIPAAVRLQLRPSAATRLHLALLRPRDLVMRQRTVLRASSADVLRLWLLAGRSRAAWMMKLLTPSADDPLQWMWNDLSEETSVPSTFVQRAGRVVKLLADQGGTYVNGAGALFSRAGREGLRLW